MPFAEAYLFAVAVLAVYMLGVSLMTTQVSYPLYAAVPAEAFVRYHERYNSRIPAVIIAPGFLYFLACAAMPVLGPDGLPGWAAAAIAAGGLTGLVATVTAAIPSHLRLRRGGFDRRVYRTLRRADVVRTVGCVVSSAVLVWAVATV
jgi:hypothetical protein